MDVSSIAHQRLVNQRLISQPNGQSHSPPHAFTRAKDIVGWMGAIQAQEYERAKWAIAQRTHGLSSDDVDQALADGSILRTHVMRPTWHFVTPEDIRWLLMLTAPRVHAVSAYYVRKLELDDAVFAKSNAVLAQALRGGRQLMRTELITHLQKAGIETGGALRIGYILMRAELDAVICSGGKRGNQFTYALLDERVPKANSLHHDEARAELVRRYFTSHGPATLQDFGWWSGLTLADAKAGIADNAAHLVQDTLAGIVYWRAAAPPPPTPGKAKAPPTPTAHLLPTYDEFLLSYKDRAVSIDPRPEIQSARDNLIFDAGILIDGRLVGTWHRTFKGQSVVVELRPLVAWTPAEKQAIAEAAERYAQFTGKPLVFAN